ncbi:hypothetical protein [Blautia sp. HCP3S3_C12]
MAGVSRTTVSNVINGTV